MTYQTLGWRLLAAGCSALAAMSAFGMTASLKPSVESTAPVGEMVTFQAVVSDAASSNLWYRFRVRPAGGAYGMVRDYGPVDTLDWTAAKHDGVYEVEVSVLNRKNGEEANATSVIQFKSRVTNGQPVVSPTANALVFLYSAAECASGSRMRVQFQTSGGATQNTPYMACTPGRSMNFYLAGLLAGGTYRAHHVIDTGSEFVTGPEVAFTVGNDLPPLYKDTIVVPSRPGASNPILLGGPLGGHPVANDLAGNVIWYGPEGMTFLTWVAAGGEFWSIQEQAGADQSQQIVRKYDLAGMTLLETNAARVSQQLAAMGKRPITGFHHEARPVAGGRVAVLAGVEQILEDVQGPGAVDVLGDMIVVLDKDLNVVWTWDAFDNLDVYRTAVLGETCPNAGCPTYYFAATAKDWTHGNALQETADGELLYSARNQDWLVKISYDGGNGDGHVVWKLGLDGDFDILSSDPYPWFSHQHDGKFEIGDPTRLMVFDDGNTRVAEMRGGNSRGQVLQIDERNRTVIPVLNADLGVYSMAVGSAQRLRDGNYHFDAGFVSENGTIDSYSFEVDAAGRIQYEAHQDVILYRTFRMSDMYTPN